MNKFIPLLGLLAIILVSGCTTQPELTYERALLAEAKGSGELMENEEAKFFRGDVIALILLNVGPFQRGDDGLNWFDMDINVTYPDGTLNFSETGILGEDGHMDIENNIANYPHVFFYSTFNEEPGNYTISMAIYDKIDGRRIEVSRSFLLR